MGKEKSNGLSNSLRISLKIRKGLSEKFMIRENGEIKKKKEMGKEKVEIGIRGGCEAVSLSWRVRKEVIFFRGKN